MVDKITEAYLSVANSPSEVHELLIKEYPAEEMIGYLLDHGFIIEIHKVPDEWAEKYKQTGIDSGVPIQHFGTTLKNANGTGDMILHGGETLMQVLSITFNHAKLLIDRGIDPCEKIE